MRRPLKVARSMLVTTVATGFVVVATIAHAAPNPCAAGKDKCVGKKVAAILKCYSKADNPGLAAADLAACIQKVKDKFVGCVGKLEAKFAGACLTTSDEGRLEAKVDTFVAGAFCALHPADPACACQATTGGFCWFLSVAGDDCDTTCAAVDRLYDEATRSYAGSDGTDANCQAVATALGGGAFLTSQSLGRGGLGCVINAIGGGFCGPGVCIFRDLDTTSSSSSDGSWERACACR